MNQRRIPHANSVRAFLRKNPKSSLRALARHFRVSSLVAAIQLRFWGITCGRFKSNVPKQFNDKQLRTFPNFVRAHPAASFGYIRELFGLSYPMARALYVAFDLPRPNDELPKIIARQEMELSAEEQRWDVSYQKAHDRHYKRITADEPPLLSDEGAED